MRHYLNFVLNALTGHNPDEYFRTYEKEILYVQRQLLTRFSPKARILYRGVLAAPNLERLLPLDHITYLSFTEDLEVAETFADPNSPMADFVKLKFPDFVGYLIEHVPQADEVLFHYDWADFLSLSLYLDDSILKEQKEVIIKQTGIVFELIPFSGTSTGKGLAP